MISRTGKYPQKGFRRIELPAVIVLVAILAAHAAPEVRPRPLAFPSAEGYGRFALGGRGGRVIQVTNLANSGPGTLRAAVEAEGPRTVVFNVSGLITLESRLIIRKTNSNLTLAGQTAPGKGICIRKFNLGMLGATNVIVRYLRVRPGNISGTTLDGMGMASSDDASSIIARSVGRWTRPSVRAARTTSRSSARSSPRRSTRRGTRSIRPAHSTAMPRALAATSAAFTTICSRIAPGGTGVSPVA
jgi:hypothetical protein